MEISPELKRELAALFERKRGADELADDMQAVAVVVLHTLRQLRGPEFVASFLEGAADDLARPGTVPFPTMTQH